MHWDLPTALILAGYRHRALLAEAEREREIAALREAKRREPGPQEPPLRHRLFRWFGRRRPVL